MIPDFLCKCGHRNKFHASLEESFAYNKNEGRICLEFKDAVFIKGAWYHNKEWICECNDFVGDNLLTLEQQSETMV